MKLGFPISISVVFWMLSGLLRSFDDRIFRKRMYVRKSVIKKKLRDVAVCIPAHNEERVLERTIKKIKKQVPSRQIFVVSDGSTDKTTKIARKLHCKVLENLPGKGKARALVSLFKHFEILKHYQFVLLIDAEVTLGANYLQRALRVFETHPEIVAISGYVITPWRKNLKLTKKRFIEAYRVRLNRILQTFLVYGQSWKYTNSPIVIPGGCSIYRTSVLKRIRIDTPGLLIEDFNITFQVHKKRLGKIAHYPEIYVYDQEPTTFKDYWNQIRRWNIGFLQTVKKQGIWPSLFWVLVGLFIVEVLINALFVVIMPMFLLTSTYHLYLTIFIPQTLEITQYISRNYILFWELSIFIFIFDYIFTVFVALKEKRYIFLVFGLGFLLFRYMDSLSFLISIPQALFVNSKGRWISPKRS
jgi:cellulose synthase/poly-beta-1,6-N-acetylglucosamine synthase-like glycosyltransferase